MQRPTSDFAGICLMVLLGWAQCSCACVPIAGHKYSVPTEEEQFARADVVFSGTVVEVRDAPELKGVTRHPYPIVATMKVRKWEKGAAGELVQVVDTGGTDCDGLFGIFHISLPNRNAVPSPGWRVFARKANGRIFVITVGRPDEHRQ